MATLARPGQETPTPADAGARPGLREQRLAIARRLRDHIVAGTSDLAEAPMRISADVYTDPLRFAAERQRIFRETPVIACLSGDVPDPGNFVTFDDSGAPVLVVRGKDGQVRAFLNMCPHRGARLVQPEAGRAARFTCGFHGWTFANDGKLLAATEPQHFGEELAGCSGLVALPCAERHGFVFVVTTPGAALDLDAHLGSFDEQLAFLGVEGLVPLDATVLTAKSNWKFVLDTFFESYHLASMHRTTLFPNYRNDIHLFDMYDRHGRYHAVNREAEKYLLSEPEAQWEPDHRWYGSSYVFPNSYVTASPRPAQATTDAFFIVLIRLFPGDAIGETRIHLAFYGPAEMKTPAYAEQIGEALRATADLLQNEDFAMAEQAWPGLLAAPADQRFVIGRQERLVQEIERSIADAVGMPLAP